MGRINFMKRKSRLSRSEKSRKRDRLDDLRPDEDMSLLKVVDDMKSDLHDSHEELTRIAAEDEAHLQKNLKVARQLMESGQHDHTLLKVELDNEPADGEGRVAFLRAEDFLHFDSIEVESVYTGNVHTVPRTSVAKIIGRVGHETAPEHVGGLGVVERGD